MKKKKSKSEKELKFVGREEWGAAPSTESLPPLTTPVELVVTYPETNTPVCYTKKECITRMQEIQKKHMNKGQPDIPYSFLIGLDGRVYEGRGWNTQAGRIMMNKDKDGKAITIAFIGNFEDWTPPYPMTDAVEALVNYGVKNNFIKKRHRRGYINWDTKELEFEDDCNHAGKKKPTVSNLPKAKIINIPKAAETVLTTSFENKYF